MNNSKAIIQFKKKYKNRKEIDHVIDYLISVYPYKKRFNFSYEQALDKANEWNKKLNEKNKNQITSGKIETILEFDKGFKLVRLIDQESKNWEGFHMGHCISSYQDHEGIYSLRDRNNIPKCTIEIVDDYINQIKGKANGAIAPIYVDYVLKSLEHFNHNINLHDIENIGYLELTNDIKESFTNLKIITINDKKYFYAKNQLKLSKNPKYKQKIFYILCKTGQVGYIKQCIHSKVVDPSAIDNYAIRMASLNGYYQIVALLLQDKRVNPSAASNESIRLASKHGHYKVVDLLLQDERVDPSDWNNDSIRLASEYGNDKIVKLLLKDKRVDSSDAYNSSIKSASLHGHYKVVDLLLQDKRVDPSAGNNYAIKVASINGHYKIVEFLLQDKRANTSAASHESIRLASKYGHYKIVDLLLQDKRVDPSADNNSALQLASTHKHYKILKLLIEDPKFDPSINNNFALRWASKAGHFQTVKLLLQHKKVNPSDKTMNDYFSNHSASELANKNGHYKIAKLLKKYN